MATPTRRQQNHDWTASPQTRIYTRNPRQPRDEYTQFAKTSIRTRPVPMILASDQPSPLLKTPLDKGRTDEDRSVTLTVPEVVDIADTNVWPQRSGVAHRSTAGRVPSPSFASRCSTRQSEMSYGVLDYYMQDPSPLTSPKYPATPRINTPVLGPAIDKFDFGLDIATSSTKSAESNEALSTRQDAIPGAERESVKTTSPPPIKSLRPKQEPKRSYRLFPTVQEATPTQPTLSTKEPRTPRTHTTSPPSTIHTQPDASYRPRKECLTSSIRSRKDSLTSFRGTHRIPLRILSNSTTTSSSSASKPTKSCASSSTDSPSTASDSRWSDETITSPLVATTPGPRTSFGSLFQVEGRPAEWPACFFEEDEEEEDDEGAPLRRKFPWKRKGEGRELTRRGIGRFEERKGKGLGRRVRGWFLCAGCCG